MAQHRLFSFIRVIVLVFGCLEEPCFLFAQGAKHMVPDTAVADPDADHVKERSAWFLRGRVIRGESAAEFRRLAYQTKMWMRAQRASIALSRANASLSSAAGTWIPLGPAPLASDASGTSLQDYHQVAGRATAVAIDPADPSGNTVYIGGAQAGVWKSTNAANITASNVTWTPLTDAQATLSIGSIAIQPGNSDPTKTVILAATGEADNSGDSYFGLGILRSADAGNSWTLIPTANNGTLSFSGLGGTRMAFSTANTVVSAMATTSEGTIDGAVTNGTTRGLYTSIDAGQHWSYNALIDSDVVTDATSATSVVYNAFIGAFFAAIRYHGFYSSPDGTHWTRLANQPGGSALSITACPPQSTSNGHACPMYRGEIAVVPKRNEMYAWYIYLDASSNPVDGHIWQSIDGGNSWTEINDDGITNCGNEPGCGVQQGYYNLALTAVPNAAVATDLYAGAINLYKCKIANPASSNPSCDAHGFMNLTHVYGCDPIAAPAHVHPDQHAISYLVPTSGTDAGNALMFFANDGGIYRSLDGYNGLKTGLCSEANLFDDLNQNLGSMTQFVTFSQHPTDANTLLGGTQDNGAPATASATTSTGWVNVNGGDGGFNAIDPAAPANWFVSNPDIPPGGLNIQECSNGVSCREGNFNVMVDSGTVGGDDGAFYFPFILDPQSQTSLLVGTCRVWRGPRLSGSYNVLSPNFDTFGAGTCSGAEVNQVRGLAAGGPTDSYGSKVIYATTDGLGPLDGPMTSPVGGNVWVTTNATAGTPAFAEVSQNINPNQFPVSSVAIDTSDATGNTAFVTVMGFTGGPGHVWKTSNAGASWSDFTGGGSTALPDAPVNAVVIDPGHNVYVGTDVGVFQSSTSSASWTEVGPSSGSGQTGFLPNVAVTALGIFNSGTQKLLRASTYGRGVWQVSLEPDFQIAISNSPQTIFPAQSATFNGTVTALNGYGNVITLSCISGTTTAPATCTPKPPALTATTNTPFTLTAGGAVGDYTFNVQGIGSDSSTTTETAPLTLHIVNFGLTAPSPGSVNVAPGSTSSSVSFQVTAAGSFNQSVTVSCGVNISGAGCSLTPGNTVYPVSAAAVPMTATVTVPAGTSVGNYTATLSAITAGAPAPITQSFGVNVTTTPDFTLSAPASLTLNAGSTNTGANLSIGSINGFSGTVNLTCTLSGNGSCSASPASVNSFPATSKVTVNAASLAAGSYQFSVTATSGSLTQTATVSLNVGDYQLSGTTSLTLGQGTQNTASITITASSFYSGRINATCIASVLPGAGCSVTPPSPITVNSGSSVILTATITAPDNAASGTYNISVNTQDKSGAPAHTLTIAVTVTQDFILSASTASQTAAAGQTTGAYNLVIKPTGASFTSSVALSCPSGLPSGSKCNFTSNPVTPGSGISAAMTISTPSTTATGIYQITVTGTSGALSHSAAVSLTVTTAVIDDFQLAVKQAFPTTVDAGSQPAAQVTVTPTYSGSLKARCNASGLSGGICTVSPATLTVTAGTSTTLKVALTIPSTAAVNPTNSYTVTLTVTDSSGQPNHILQLPLTLIQDFSISSATPTQTVHPGQTTGAYQLTVGPNPAGSTFANAVTLSCSSGLPSGAQCLFSPSASVTPGATATSVVMTISTASKSSAIWPGKLRSIFYATWAILPAMVIACGAGGLRPRRMRGILCALAALFVLGLTMSACGGGTGSSGGANGNQGIKPATYTVTVTGVSSTVDERTTVSLVVQ
jgi:hypothetical protein